MTTAQVGGGAMRSPKDRTDPASPPFSYARQDGRHSARRRRSRFGTPIATAGIGLVVGALALTLIELL